MKQSTMNESISYADSSGKTKTTSIEEALRTSQDYSRQLSQMEQMSNIQSTGRTDDYVKYTISNYGENVAEKIFDHNNSQYNTLREESFRDFARMQEQPSNFGAMNKETHMQEMQTRAFLHKFDSNNHMSMGSSNKDVQHDSSRMIPNAQYNISENEKRFDSKFKDGRDSIEARADDNVFVGVVKAGIGQPKDIFNDMKDGMKFMKELGSKNKDEE